VSISNTEFSYPNQGLRVSGSGALSGVLEKNESALETWFVDNEKRDIASYVSTKANLKILEN
jgi:hypothetical protein